MKDKSKTLLTIAFFAFILFLFLFLVWLILSALTDIFTLPGGILLLVSLVIYILRLLLRMAVFPGSIWLWRRSIEAHFCKEMSRQLYLKLKDIELSLLIIINKASEFEKRDFLSRGPDSPLHAKNLILTIIDTFMILKEETGLTQNQRGLLELLIQLQINLQESILVLPNKEFVPYWDWVNEVKLENEWLDVQFEDFSENYSANSALSTSQEVLIHLHESYGDASAFKSVYRWLWDSTLGTIEQMRIEMETRFRFQQIWVESADKTRIDCIYLPNEDATKPVVLLLNPNAGFFEFAYYQNDWIEFYMNRGLNIMMMNYRGYGRTQGAPTPDTLKVDGEAVVDYLINVKRATMIGIHGESLGGMLAVHLGRVRPVSYLYADRTFSKLTDVAKYNFGNCANWYIKWVSRWETDCALDYLYTDCYKVIASDALDMMINDLGSLKTGVSVRLLETQGLHHYAGIRPASIDLEKYSHILSPEQFASFHQSFVSLMRFIMTYDRGEDDHSITSNQQYFPIGKGLEGLDEELVSNLLYNLFNVLDNLDAAGKVLSTVYSEKYCELSLKVWVISLDVWGSYYPLALKESPKEKAREKLGDAVDHLRSICENESYSTNPLVIEIIRLAKQLQYSLSILLEELKASQIDDPTLRTARMSRAGNLIPLSCGHTGTYNVNEKTLVEWHLEKSGLLE